MHTKAVTRKSTPNAAGDMLRREGQYIQCAEDIDFVDERSHNRGEPDVPSDIFGVEQRIEALTEQPGRRCMLAGGYASTTSQHAMEDHNLPVK